MQVVGMLVELRLVDLADYTVDGTTLEANARREEQIPEEHSSDADSGSPVRPTKKDLKMARTRLRWITETEIPKVSNYEGQLQTLGDRNSYSKTDPDATFMRTGD